MDGPVVQLLLFHILLRFRSHLVAMTGNKCKMYCCERMDTSDRDILWRDLPLDKLQTFKLDTVTYGTKLDFYIFVRSMHQLAKDEVADFPVGAEILLRDYQLYEKLLTGFGSFLWSLVNVEEARMARPSIQSKNEQSALSSWSSH